MLRWLKENRLLEASVERRVAIVTDEAMVLHSGPAGHPEQPARLQEIVKQLELSGLLQACAALPSHEATEEELKRTHASEYVDKVLASAELGVRRREGAKAYRFPFGPDTYVNDHTAKAARLAAGCLVGLVDACLDEASPTRTGMAVVRPPGHHATSDKAMGFCLFNNVAVAARHAQKKHGLGRIAIIDWDVHHGNGTSDLFANDESVLFFSMHRWDSGFFPGTGFLEDAGQKPARGYTVNVPLEKGFKDHDVCHVVRYILCPLLDKFKPDAIFVSAGFDAVKGDPLGECKLSPECFGWMARCISRMARHYCEERLFLVLEGGYDPDLIAQCTVECVQSLLAEANDLPGPQWQAPGAFEGPTPGASALQTPATSVPGTPSASPAGTPKLKAATPPGTPNLTPLSSPKLKAATPPSSPMVGPAGATDRERAKQEKGRQCSARTRHTVRQLTEIHHLLPLQIPLAPVETAAAAKNARRQERRKKKKSGDEGWTDGASSDSSGWAIACGLSDGEELTPKLLSRQSSGDMPGGGFMLPSAACSGSSVGGHS